MVEKIVWTKKTIEDTISSLQIYFNKIVNETPEGIDVKVLDALLIEKIYLFVTQLQTIQKSLSLNGEVDSKIQDKLNSQYQDILNVQNNNYSKQNSVHKDLYELILRINNFYFFLQNDFLKSYTSIIDLILKQDLTLVSHKDDILREFKLLLKNLNELDSIIDKLSLHNDLRINIFYDYVKHYILKDKDKLISLDLLKIFYNNFIGNKSANVKKLISILELEVPKFESYKFLTLENIVDFVSKSNLGIIFFVNLFKFDSLESKNTQLLGARYIIKIQNTFEMISSKITEVMDLDLDNQDLIITDLNKFIRNLKDRKFKNINLGLIIAKTSYYILGNFISNLQNNSKDFEKIRINFSSSLEFLEYCLDLIEPKVIQINDILDSSDNVKEIVSKYYSEIKSEGFKKLEFEFESEPPIMMMKPKQESLSSISEIDLLNPDIELSTQGSVEVREKRKLFQRIMGYMPFRKANNSAETHFGDKPQTINKSENPNISTKPQVEIPSQNQSTSSSKSKLVSPVESTDNYSELAKDYFNKKLGGVRINFKRFSSYSNKKVNLKKVINSYGLSIKSFESLSLFLRLVGINTINRNLTEENLDLIDSKLNTYLLSNEIDLSNFEENIIKFVELLVLRVNSNVDISKVDFKDEFNTFEKIFESCYNKIIDDLKK